MKVTFRTFQGLAGELDQLLICESQCGHKVTRLYSTVGLFKLYKLRRAKRMLKRKLELKTGKKIVECEHI